MDPGKLSKWSTLYLVDNKFNDNVTLHLSRPIPSQYTQYIHWEEILNINIFIYIYIYIFVGAIQCMRF